MICCGLVDGLEIGKCEVVSLAPVRVGGIGIYPVARGEGEDS